MDIKHEGMEVSSDDEKYLVPGYKPPKEEEPDEVPHDLRAYANAVEDIMRNMPREQLEAVAKSSHLQLKQMTMNAEAAAAGGKQYKTGKWDPIHDMILVNDVVIRVKKDMEGLQKTNPLALWWVVEWGKEYLARFRNGPDSSFAPYSKSDLKKYHTWTNKQKDRASMKVLGGMTATIDDDDDMAGSVTPASVPTTPGSASSSKKAKKSAGSPFV